MEAIGKILYHVRPNVIDEEIWSSGLHTINRSLIWLSSQEPQVKAVELEKPVFAYLEAVHHTCEKR